VDGPQELTIDYDLTNDDNANKMQLPTLIKLHKLPNLSLGIQQQTNLKILLSRSHS
jgi:hypothetical protein